MGPWLEYDVAFRRVAPLVAGVGDWVKRSRQEQISKTV
jgi:hypothetical protein